MTALSTGNLASHLETLERSGYVRFEMTVAAAKRSKTVVLTEKGDHAFREYIARLRELLGELSSAANPTE
jgi:DNA-binding MarR family transcriptional regulator